MKIACDLESVLADSHEAVYRSSDRLSYDDLYDSWKFDEDTWQRYIGASDAIWRHKPEIIAPQEPNLSQYISALREDNTVDILTARLHVDEQAKWWLAEHGIEYDDFIATEKPKPDFDYDLFIDDNPEMFGECRLLLRHQPWNTHCVASEAKLCDRIYSLAEAVEFV